MEILPAGGEEAGKGNEELYDHVNDPEEYVNLAGDVDYNNVLEEMRMKFEEAREKAKSGLTIN